MGVVALLPLLLFPLLDVFGGSLAAGFLDSASPFIDAYMFLFLGGMMLGAAMEATGLHRRTALHIMKAVGTGPKRLLLGILVATAAVSAFVSNTATAVMMLPIAAALVGEIERVGGRSLPKLGCALVLAVAYGANIGGIGTKIGTGTNSIFCGLAESKLGRPLSFLEFSAFAAPCVLVLLPLAWGALWRLGRRDGAHQVDAGGVVREALSAMGPMSAAERKVAVAFFLAAGLWIGGDLLRPVLTPHVPQLWDGFRFLGKHYEALVAMTVGLGVVALRTLPIRGFLRLPWSSLLLLGGSFAMAAGVEASGLADQISKHLSGMAEWPLLAQTLVTAALAVVVSAVASNTATVNIMLNVLPRSMPVWATAALASSCDFMLPAGTPPNAIVFGSGRVRLRDMMSTGALLDLAAILVLPLLLTWRF